MPKSGIYHKQIKQIRGTMWITFQIQITIDFRGFLPALKRMTCFNDHLFQIGLEIPCSQNMRSGNYVMYKYIRKNASYLIRE